MTDRSLAPVADAWPSAEEVAGVVEAVASSAGHAVSDLSVELAPGEWGGRAYACTLTTGDPAWDQPLIARAAAPGDALRAAAAGGEAAWHAHLDRHGVAVPPIVAVSDGDGDGLAATVMQRTHEHSLIEVISANPTDAAASAGARRPDPRGHPRRADRGCPGRPRAVRRRGHVRRRRRAVRPRRRALRGSPRTDPRRPSTPSSATATCSRPRSAWTPPSPSTPSSPPGPR